MLKHKNWEFLNKSIFEIEKNKKSIKVLLIHYNCENMKKWGFYNKKYFWNWKVKINKSVINSLQLLKLNKWGFLNKSISDINVW